MVPRRAKALILGLGVALAVGPATAQTPGPVPPSRPLDPGRPDPPPAADGPAAPTAPVIVDPELRQVQLRDPLGAATQGGQEGGGLRDPLGGAASVGPGPSGGNPSITQAGGGTEARADTAAQASAPGTSAISGAGGVAGAALGASDVGKLLTDSPQSAGVEVQRRNTIVADPRIRGYRAGQYLTIGDGGLFYPARADLDTAIAKYEPGSTRDIIVVKGPYSALYGPGFAFFDVATIDSPRYADGFEWHGRTGVGFQTNGARWEGLQSFSVGDRTWGARVTFTSLQGNDYRAGDGTLVPSSYRSNTLNYAVGFDLTPKSKVEVKGLNSILNDLEFPGLYFGISQSETASLTARYTLVDQGFFDKYTFDVWYNHTTASGDTQQASKQAFVQQLLGQSFNPQFGTTVVPVRTLVGDPRFALFNDLSDTRFAGRSIGYRAAMSWGPKDDPYLTAGTDLNVFGQGLVENIRLQQLQGVNLNTGVGLRPGETATFTQTQRIPESNQVNPGLFLQGMIPVTQRLKLRPGGRVDWVRSSSNPRTITGNIDLFGSPQAPGQVANRFSLDPIVYSANPNDPALSRDFGLVSGFLRTEYKLDDAWTLLAAVGHGQRAPTLTELYAAGPFIGVLQQGTSRLIGDPNLSPERVTQMDVGLTADYEFFQFGVNGFYAWIDDYITYDVNKSGLGLTQVVYTNTDRATLAGAELFTQMDWTAWLTTFGTLSYVQGVDQTAVDRRRPAALDSSRRDDPLTLRRKARTEPLAQIPPLESRLGIRLHAPSKAPTWQLEFSTRIVADQNNVATSLGELRTPGFAVFNVRGFWKATDNLLVTAGVENLGDITYREHLDPISGNLLGVGPMLRPGVNYFFNMQYTY